MIGGLDDDEDPSPSAAAEGVPPAASEEGAGNGGNVKLPSSPPIPIPEKIGGIVKLLPNPSSPIPIPEKKSSSLGPSLLLLPNGSFPSKAELKEQVGGRNPEEHNSNTSDGICDSSNTLSFPPIRFKSNQAIQCKEG